MPEILALGRSLLRALYSLVSAVVSSVCFSRNSTLSDLHRTAASIVLLRSTLGICCRFMVRLRCVDDRFRGTRRGGYLK
jgi:hypothetical protein